MVILSVYQSTTVNIKEGIFMLAELRMKLEVDKPEFGYYQSSNMQGILMEQIDRDYAACLHEQGLKPYSQYLLIGAEKEWIVKTCTKEAYQQIIVPLLNQHNTHFVIEKKNINIKIKEKQLRTIDKKELLNEFYADDGGHYLNLEFLTPVSFKSHGRYVIMPDTRYIYQSLMNKYSASSDKMDMYDEETLEHLVNNSSIVHYRLKSTFFPVEGVKIPSFKGEMSIRVSGTNTMAGYARLLARFGEYAGVGIKTAMGMGALRLRERGQIND